MGALVELVKFLKGRGYRVPEPQDLAEYCMRMYRAWLRDDRGMAWSVVYDFCRSCGVRKRDFERVARLLTRVCDEVIEERAKEVVGYFPP
ncbi:MAG: hypothetical protein ACXQT2_04450 [Methanotrichaceae archaeon]